MRPVPTRPLAVSLVLCAALTACGKSSAPAHEHSHLPGVGPANLFTNGDFENGTLSGWTVTTSAVPSTGMPVSPPTKLSDLGLSGSSVNKTSVKTGATGTLIPYGLTSASTLRYPRYGNATAVVNEGGASNNSNTLLQQMTTTNADVDPADNKVHVRFAIAPVLQNPNHAANAQPYFWVQLKNVTKGTILFWTFNFANQSGVPWKTDSGGAVQYTDWQLFDISPGAVGLAVGDTVEMMIIASGCAAGGHWGEVYVDAFGPQVPGLQVTASAPQSVNTGSQFTYTFNYKNGGTAAATNTTIVETLPTGTTFASVSAPGATCTTPAVGGTGAVSCNVGTVSPSASGSFTVTVNVTGASGTTISNGNYNISGDGVASLIGPLITTSVTSAVQYADLQVTTTDGVAGVTWGGSTTYTIVASNAGPVAANGATFSYPVPANAASQGWTCAAAGGASCGGASGAGAINQSVNLPVGGTVTYTVTTTIAASGSGNLVSQPTITAPAGVTDNNTGNNVAVDTDAIGTLYPVTVQKSGTGQGTVLSSPAAISCGTSCSSQTASFLGGSSVVLTATAATGHAFSGWSGGGCTGAQATCTVSVAAATTVTAQFDPIIWNLTASTASGTGTISCPATAAGGTNATCTITPGSRYVLSALTDNGVNVLGAVSGGQYVISNVTSNHTVSATFVATSSSAAVTATPSGSSTYGAAVTLNGTVSGVTPAGTPTGNVTFKDGGTTLCTAALSSGAASCSPAALAGGSHSFTLSYAGDTTYNGVTSPAVAYTVNKAASGLTLTPASATVGFGTPAVLTATLSGVAGGARPAGSVQFFEDGVSLGYVAPDGSGVALLSRTPSVGPHAYTASYGGDGNYTSSSATANVTVVRATPGVVLSASPSPSSYGQGVTFHATVTGTGATATGTVTFTDAAGGTICAGGVTLSAGAADCTVPLLAAGTHPVTASYGGDGNFTSASSATLSHLVSPAVTTTTLGASPSPSVHGQVVTLTASIAADLLAGPPAGTVTFTDGGTVMCADVAVVASNATCALATTLAAGHHAFQASFTGTGGFASSTSATLSHDVGPGTATVTLATGKTPTVTGETVTFILGVSGAGVTPTGTVTVREGGTTVCTATLSGGSGTCSTSTLGVGSHGLTAAYAGDASYDAATSTPITQVVNAGTVALAVGSSAAPSVYGQQASLSVTVSAVAPATGQPSGTVTFSEGGTVFCNVVPVAAQVATCALPPGLAVGAHHVTVDYSGDGAFQAGSTSLDQVVEAAQVQLAVSSAQATTVFGEPVTVTVTVAADLPSGAVPAGTVDLLDGGVVIATLPLAPGGAARTSTAQLTTSTLAVRDHALTAAYAGTGFVPASAPTFTQHVLRAATTTALAASSATSTYGDAVTLTATVAATSPGAGLPQGTVTFQADGAVIGTGTLDGSGAARLTVSDLAPGVRSLTAAFAGDGSFEGSTLGTPLVHAVDKAPASVALISSAAPAVVGQTVTFTATVTSPWGTPAGTVDFADGATVLCPSVALNGNQATCTTSALALGSHAVTATYGGDATHATATSLALDEVIGPASTQLALSVTPTPAVFGEAAGMRATVAVVAPASGTPAGTISFTVDGVARCTGVAVAAGEASCALPPTLDVRTHHLGAVFTGTASYGTSSAAADHVVQAAGVSVALLTSDAGPRYGAPVTFTATVAAEARSTALPTGTLQFLDGGQPLGTPVTLDGAGVATLTTAALTPGAHVITAAYGGDAGHVAGTSAEVAELVKAAAVRLVLASTPQSSLFGQRVDVRVTASAEAPSQAVPAGTVTLLDGASPLATLTLSGAGEATWSTTALAVGNHPLTAVLAASDRFETATSPAVAQAVGKASTTTALLSSAATSTYGVPLTLTATVAPVAPGAGVPGGTVTFTSDGAVVGTGALDASGVATLVLDRLPAGVHDLAASYPGDPSFGASATAAPVVQAIDRAAVAVALTATPASSVFGQPVVLEATVTSAAFVPGGTVVFEEGGVELGRGTLSGAGKASFGTAALPVGAHPIVARYLGADDYLAASSAAAVADVARAPTRVALAAQPTSSVFGQPVTLRATVAVVDPGAGTPGGTVTFFDHGASIGTGTLAAGGAASLQLSSLAAGAHDLSARYEGDGSFAPSQTTAGAGVGFTVARGEVAVALTVDPGSSVSGQPVSLTVSVAPVSPAAGTPSGTVAVKDAGATVATLTLSAGTATTSVTTFAPGAHALTAEYAGDDSFAPGTGSGSATVGRAATTTQLASSGSPSRAGQPVTLTASVAVTAPGAGTPTGAVTFKDGGASLGTGAVDGTGHAVLTVPFTAGSHALTAEYAGDDRFVGSTGALTQAVDRAATTLALTAAPTPSMYGQQVTIRARVGVVAPGTGTPGGTVTFLDGGAALGTGTLGPDGEATLDVASLVAGHHALSARYGGATQFEPSEGQASHEVQPGSVTAEVASSRNPSRFGRPVTFTATLRSPHQTPVGEVTFLDGETVLGTATLHAGTATLARRDLVKGTHPISVRYAPDANFQASTGTLSGGEVVENTPPVAGSGTALAFGGAGSAGRARAVTVAVPGDALALAQGTVELWLRAGWSAPADVAAAPGLVRLGATDAPRFALGVSPARDALVVTLGATTASIPAAFADQAWHHVALVGGADHAAVYLDGAPAGEVPAAFGAAAASELVLGEGFAGELDEVRLWSSLRTPAELAAAMRHPLHGDEPGLAGLWRADEGAGLELFDAGPSHLDGAVALVDPAATPAAFVPSTAWRLREVPEEREMAPVDAGYDADGDPLTLSVATAPAHGTTTLDASGLRIVYRPGQRFLGDDQFVFALDDGTDASEYTIDVGVSRILVCQVNTDCGGGDVCMNGQCVAPHSLHGRSGCSTGGDAAALWALVALGLLLRAGRRRSVAAAGRALVVLALLGAGGAASAQTPKAVDVQAWTPPAAGDGFFTVPDATTPGHLAPAAGLAASFAADPLVLERDGRAVPGGKLVHRQLWGFAQASLGLGERFLVEATLPVALWQQGEQPFPDLGQVRSSGLGNARLGGRMHLGRAGPAAFAAGLEVRLPSGARPAFASDGGPSATPYVVAAGEAGRWVWGADLGILLRKAQDVAYTRTGVAVPWALAAAWRTGAWRLGPEAWGRVQFDGSVTSPVEVMLGAHWRPCAWDVGLGASTELNTAPGASPLRVVSTVSWRPGAGGCGGAQDQAAAAPRAQAVAAAPAAPATPTPEAPAASGPPAATEAPGAVAAGPAAPPANVAAGEAQPPASAGAPSTGAPSTVAPSTGAPSTVDPSTAPAAPQAEVATLDLPVALFATDSAAIGPQAAKALGEVAVYLRAHPELGRVAVEGHADSRGAAAWNQTLSERRARAAVAWLASHGVEAARLLPRGFGASHPAAPNETAAGRAANRRVEVKPAR